MHLFSAKFTYLSPLLKFLIFPPVLTLNVGAVEQLELFHGSVQVDIDPRHVEVIHQSHLRGAEEALIKERERERERERGGVWYSGKLQDRSTKGE